MWHGPRRSTWYQEGGSLDLSWETLVDTEVDTDVVVYGRKNPDQFLSRSKEALSEPDRLVLDQPEVAKAYIDTVREAFRSGTGGADQEATLYTRPWQFRLQYITTEMYLWHGELDLSIPISVGRYAADAIPNCHATFLKDEAHISLPHNYIREILSVLIA